jgi:glutathione S-transferase
MNGIKILGRRSSFNVQKVLWLLDYLSVDYQHTEMGGRFGGLDTAEFLDWNPHGKVPVLIDGELVIWESHTILRYLAATYGSDEFWPRDPAARSYLDRWLDWAATRLQPDFMDLFWGYYRMPETQRDLEAIKRARQDCARDYELLDSHLRARTFLDGDNFTLADIPAGATLYRYFEMGLAVPQPDNVMSWYERLRKIPSYRRQITIPFDELYGRETY